MLYIKADEPRTLTFEVDINGIGKSDLKGFVRFFINDSEHGFPVAIEDGFITADIPPLAEIVKLRTLEDGDIVEAKLDLMTDSHIFTPWSGEVKVSVPMGIKAKLSSEAIKEEKKVAAKVVVSKEDKAVEKAVRSSAVKASVVTEELRDLKTDDPDENYKADLANLVKSTIQDMDLVPRSSLDPKPLLEQDEKCEECGKKECECGDNKIKEEVTKQKKLNEKDLLVNKIKNITKEGIYKYMNKAGTSNPKIQELVYEQAEAAAGSTEPFKVLKHVVKILKKRR